MQVEFEMPFALRCTIPAASLPNTRDQADTFLPADLLQEHDVLALKHMFPLHGSNGSPE